MSDFTHAHTTTRTPRHVCPFPETGCTATSCPHVPRLSPGAVFAAVRIITDRIPVATEDHLPARQRRRRARAW